MYVRLYHGSNAEVRVPEILVSNRSLDFGSGFYAISSCDQAQRWAELQTGRRKTGVPTVNVYDFDLEKAANLAVRRFETADGSWLNFVAENRKNIYNGVKYDIVIGPVANDITMTVISDYIAGSISEEMALILLKPRRLTDQYAFLTVRGLSAFRFIEVKNYDKTHASFNSTEF